VAAIGAGTRRALEAEGMVNVIAPEGQSDTEALLACAEFNSVRGERIVVFRGIDGREQLAATLRSRGAIVDYAECYRRNRPRTDPKALIDAYSAGSLDAITISSAEGLANLDEGLDEAFDEGGKDVLRGTPLFVPHPRVAEAAKALGIGQVVVAGPGNAEMLTALVAYFAHSG
jgi:uroporphyrinogen-III synthase